MTNAGLNNKKRRYVMKKLLDYVLSAVYVVWFMGVLLVFHGLQVVAFSWFGQRAHQWAVNGLNWCITYGFYLTGTRVRFRQLTTLPQNRPLIVVANHQSMFDISPLSWLLRRHTPIFVSKIELARGFPSVSYNLRKNGSALINRNDQKQALAEIARMGKQAQTNKQAAVIFPEGTRSPTGRLKSFAPGGLAILLKRIPDALVVPVVIQGTGPFNPQGLFPLTSFSCLSWTVLPGIEPAGKTADEVTQAARAAIETVLNGVGK
jgi:1-acyl-sn-glycerol-3-phosphate acyltransferase